MKSFKVSGIVYEYDARFDDRPYAYFDIPKNKADDLFKVAKAIERRCRKVFNSAKISHLEMWETFNCKRRRYEGRVYFSITEDERLKFKAQRGGWKS